MTLFLSTFLLFAVVLDFFSRRYLFPYADPCGIIALARVLQERGKCAYNYIRPFAVESNFGSEVLEYLEDRTYYLYSLIVSSFPTKDPLVLNRAGIRLSNICALVVVGLWFLIVHGIALSTGGWTFELFAIYLLFVLHPSLILMSVRTATDILYFVFLFSHFLLLGFGIFADSYLFYVLLGASAALAYLIRTHAFVLTLSNLTFLVYQILVSKSGVAELLAYGFGFVVMLGIFFPAAKDAFLFYYDHFFGERVEKKARGYQVIPSAEGKNYVDNTLVNFVIHNLNGVVNFFDIRKRDYSIFGLVGGFAGFMLYGVLSGSLFMDTAGESQLNSFVVFLSIFFFWHVMSILSTSMVGCVSQFGARENLPNMPVMLLLAYIVYDLNSELFLVELVFWGCVLFLLVKELRIFLSLLTYSTWQVFEFWPSLVEDPGDIRLGNSLENKPNHKWWCARAKDVAWRSANNLYLRASGKYIWSKSEVERAIDQYEIEKVIIDPFDVAAAAPETDPEHVLYRLYNKIHVGFEKFRLVLEEELENRSERLLIYRVERVS